MLDVIPVWCCNAEKRRYVGKSFVFNLGLFICYLDAYFGTCLMRDNLTIMCALMYLRQSNVYVCIFEDII